MENTWEMENHYLSLYSFMIVKVLQNLLREVKSAIWWVVDEMEVTWWSRLTCGAIFVAGFVIFRHWWGRQLELSPAGCSCRCGRWSWLRLRKVCMFWIKKIKEGRESHKKKSPRLRARIAHTSSRGRNRCLPDLCLIKLSHPIRAHIYYRNHRPLVTTSQGRSGPAGVGHHLRVMDDGTGALHNGRERRMMEGDAGEQRTSTVPALFIRGCKDVRITVAIPASS